MTDDPRWSLDTRWEVQRAMNDVIREAADIVTRRSDDGKKWLPPGEIDELGDNSSLAKAGRIWVLDKLEARIQEARAVLDRVQDECRAQSGIEPSAPPAGESD